ncbi:hypothetical protein PM082_016593 [Marasmius tenuissimus]|nr:hypothetical protein PM082_016593 [Marasmius tenuissimus]
MFWGKAVVCGQLRIQVDHWYERTRWSCCVERYNVDSPDRYQQVPISTSVSPIQRGKAQLQNLKTKSIRLVRCNIPLSSVSVWKLRMPQLFREISSFPSRPRPISYFILENKFPLDPVGFRDLLHINMTCLLDVQQRKRVDTM